VRNKDCQHKKLQQGGNDNRNAAVDNGGIIALRNVVGAIVYFRTKDHEKHSQQTVRLRRMISRSMKQNQNMTNQRLPLSSLKKSAKLESRNHDFNEFRCESRMLAAPIPAPHFTVAGCKWRHQ